MEQHGIKILVFGKKINKQNQMLNSFSRNSKSCKINMEYVFLQITKKKLIMIMRENLMYQVLSLIYLYTIKKGLRKLAIIYDNNEIIKIDD